MGTVVHTSDGGNVRLGSDTSGILNVIANALNEQGSTVDQHGQTMPKGFVVFTEPQGNQTWVNATQITRVQKT